MSDEKKTTVGFYHEPDPEMVKEYGAWPLERRAAWLFAGLRMRKLLPEEVRERQDRFRKGER